MKRILGGRVGAAKWAARILVPVVAVAAVALVSAEAAYAGPSATAGSGCSTVWNYNPYGATASAYENYSYSFPSGTAVTVSSATSGVRNMIDCGPGGYAVTAERITIVTYFRVDGINLSCGGGVPGSASCSGSGSSVTLGFSVTCANKSACKHVFGSISYTAPPLGTVWQIWMQTGVTLSKNGGSAYTWFTPWV